MRTIPFTEFRKNASEILRDVERGESVDIQRHGRVIARIVPAGQESVPSWKQPGPRLAVKGASLTRVLLDQRRRGR